MDFSSTYKILLGRSWIQTSNLVSSSLHQILRFVMNNQLIIVFTEEDCAIMVNANSKKEGSRRILTFSQHLVDVVSIGWAPKNRSLVG